MTRYTVIEYVGKGILDEVFASESFAEAAKFFNEYETKAPYWYLSGEDSMRATVLVAKGEWQHVNPNMVEALAYFESRIATV